jgi:hypothetical protein
LECLGAPVFVFSKIAKLFSGRHTAGLGESVEFLACIQVGEDNSMFLAVTSYPVACYSFLWTFAVYVGFSLLFFLWLSPGSGNSFWFSGAQTVGHSNLVSLNLLFIPRSCILVKIMHVSWFLFPLTFPLS